MGPFTRISVAGFVSAGLLLCGTVGALANGPASLTEDSVLTGCSDPDPDNRIAACSIFIASGQGLKPDIAMALNNRGIGYLEKRDYGLAILDLNEALALVPDLPIALNNRCYTLAAAGRPERALKDCDEALTLLPGSEQVLDSRGYVYFRLGRYAEAIRDLDRALTSDAPIPTALYVRGAAKLKLEDSIGRNDIERARKLDRSISDKMARLGVAPQFLTESASSASAP
jgi:tetratricopeptide (TPR) repeat protein